MEWDVFSSFAAASRASAASCSSTSFSWTAFASATAFRMS